VGGFKSCLLENELQEKRRGGAGKFQRSCIGKMKKGNYRTRALEKESKSEEGRKKKKAGRAQKKRLKRKKS